MNKRSRKQRFYRQSDGKQHIGSSLRPRRQFRDFPGPPPNQGPPLRVLPVGGLGQIGMNCMLLGLRERYIMVDAGLLFPDEVTEVGMQKVLPDTSFLHQWRDRVEALVITHGHEDHIGALPWVVPALDPSTPIYASKFVMNLIERRMREYSLWDERRFKVFEIGDTFQGGPFEVETLRVTHSIPDCCGCIFRSEAGSIVHTGDWKLDQSPIDGEDFDLEVLEKIGQEGACLLMSDSTNVLSEGRSTSEMDVAKSVMQRCMAHNGKGRIISTQFASNLHRLATMKHAADATGRKLAYAGPSFFNYLTAAHKAGRAPFDPSELLELQTALDGYPMEKLLVLTTGSQGEPFAALNLAAHGASPVLNLERSDLLLYSAKVIPGNQKRVARLFNKVAEWGPEVASGPTEGLHTSGHAYKEELKDILKMVNPQNFLPVHGEYNMLHAHAALAKQHCGISNTTVIRNGEMAGFGAKMSGRQFGDTSSMAVARMARMANDAEPGPGPSAEAGSVGAIRKIGEVDLHKYYNDGYHGTGPAEEMGIDERTRISTDGILVISVAILRPGGVTARQRNEKPGTFGEGVQLKARYRIQSRAMWTDRGRFTEILERKLDICIAGLSPDSPLPLIEARVSDAAREVARKFNRKKPEVIVISHEVRFGGGGGGAGGKRGGGGARRAAGAGGGAGAAGGGGAQRTPAKGSRYAQKQGGA